MGIFTARCGPGPPCPPAGAPDWDRLQPLGPLFAAGPVLACLLSTLSVCALPGGAQLGVPATCSRCWPGLGELTSALAPALYMAITRPSYAIGAADVWPGCCALAGHCMGWVLAGVSTLLAYLSLDIGYLLGPASLPL